MKRFRYLALLGTLCGSAFAQAPGPREGDAVLTYAKPSAQEIRQHRIRDSLASARKMRAWEMGRESLLGSARLDLDADACVAYHRVARECLLTAGAFNASLPAFLPETGGGGWPEPDRTIRENMRRHALNQALDDAFLADPGGPLAGLAAGDADEGTALPEGLEERDLADAYEAHFPALVRHHGRLAFEAYASTDSGLIASLSASLSASPAAPGSGAPRDTLPWAPVPVPVRDAPEAWILRARTLTPREWSAPLRIPAGFALIRINRSPPTRRELRPLLIQLALHRKNALPVDWDARSLDHYRRHASAYRIPDTVELLVRLLPRPKDFRPRALASARRGDDTALARAAEGVPFRALRPADLPADLRARLPARLSADPGFAVAGVPATFGYWWITIRKAKPGGVTSPFASVRDDILAELRAEALDSALRDMRATLDTKRRDKSAAAARQAWLREFAARAGGEAPRDPAAAGDAAPSAPAPQAGPAGEDAAAARMAQLAEAGWQRMKREWIEANVEVTLPAP